MSWLGSLVTMTIATDYNYFLRYVAIDKSIYGCRINVVCDSWVLVIRSLRKCCGHQIGERSLTKPKQDDHRLWPR